ncbi:MAG TPA: aspartate aminotransferase family protein [Pirellulales bacterium]|jgi:adenosylmethionine-8-amino-7-oxononanoate aminotransferase|nr:aspartate aminotransferase family protein [Pirellulales bacterium]
MPREDELIERDRAFLIHSQHSAAEQEHSHVWTHGRGALLFDAEGGEFLDALAGLWNVLVGHGRDELARAAAEQMRTLAFASSFAGSTNRPAIALAERLAGLTYSSINHFFFTSGGAEANESAFKTARYYWKIAGQPAKCKIIGRQAGFHGTTLAAMSATGIESYWTMFEPRVPGFLHIESPDPYRFVPRPRSADDRRTPGQMAADLLQEAIEREGPDTVAAFIGEPVQGAGGVIVPPDDYWPRIGQICRRYRVLLIADEVITGFGRTGNWFALSRYGIEPDLMTFAKGVTSGYFPLGGLGMSDEIAAAINGAGGAERWMHAFTNSAHPVGCAVALANLEIIEREGLVECARELGRRLLTGLATLGSHANVGEVRGLGLLAAVELVADRRTKAPFPADFKAGPRVHAATQQRGMFSRVRGDIYHLAPCFVTTPAQIDRMVEILGESIAATLG